MRLEHRSWSLLGHSDRWWPEHHGPRIAVSSWLCLLVKRSPFRCNCGHSSYNKAQHGEKRGPATRFSRLCANTARAHESPCVIHRNNIWEGVGANEHHNYVVWETPLDCRPDCSILHRGPRSDGTAGDEFYACHERQYGADGQWYEVGSHA